MFNPWPAACALLLSSAAVFADNLDHYTDIRPAGSPVTVEVRHNPDVAG